MNENSFTVQSLTGGDHRLYINVVTSAVVGKTRISRKFSHSVIKQVDELQSPICENYIGDYYN